MKMWRRLNHLYNFINFRYLNKWINLGFYNVANDDIVPRSERERESLMRFKVVWIKKFI